MNDDRAVEAIRDSLHAMPVTIVHARHEARAIAQALAGRSDVAWFDAEPWHCGAFLDDVIAAVRRVRADFGRRTLGAIEAGTDAQTIAELFLADLTHVDDPLVLVFNHAEHFAEDAEFAAFFDAIAYGIPDSVRIVLSGTALPPVALGSLTVRQRARTISESFTVSEESIDEIVDTAVARLDPQTLRLLEELAVFERYDPQVLAQEPEYGDAAAAFEALRRAGAPVDVREGIFRVPALLRDRALARLVSRGGSSVAHARAASAFAKTGQLSAALYHVTKSGDARVASTFFRSHADAAVRTGNHRAIRSALALLDRTVDADVHAYVSALLARDTGSDEALTQFRTAAESADPQIAFSARAALVEGRIGRLDTTARHDLEDLERRAEAIGDDQRTHAAMLRGWTQAIVFDFNGALATLSSFGGASTAAERFNSGILSAYAHASLGDADRALADLDELIRLFENDDRIVYQTLTLVWQARLAMLLGRTTLGADAARAAQRISAGLPLRAEQAALYTALADAALNDGDVAEALAFAERGLADSLHAWYAADAPRTRALAELALARASFLRRDFSIAHTLAGRLAASAHAPAAQRAVAASEAAVYAALMGSATANADFETARAALCAATILDAADAVALAIAHDLLAFTRIVRELPPELPVLPQLAPFDALIATRRGLAEPAHVAAVGANDELFAQLVHHGPRYELRVMRAFIEHQTSAPYRERRELAAILTTRESEILTLLVDGLSNKEIAQRLILSPRTVETHVERVLGKLEVGSRSRAIAKAIRLGIVSI